MILIGSPKIKNKNIRDRIKIKIYNEEDLYDLFSKKDNEQTNNFFFINIKTLSMEQCKIMIFVIIKFKESMTMDFTSLLFLASL